MDIATTIASSTETDIVSLNALRNQTQQQLAGVRASLEDKGVGQAFLRAAKADPMGDMGFMGSLAFHALLGGPMAAFMADNFSFDLGLTGHFNEAATMGVMEGLSALEDTAAQKGSHKKLRSALYPKGRNTKADVKKTKTKAKFNRVAANQNGKFTFDVQAELAYMYELVDMLEKLEQQGITGLSDSPHERAAQQKRVVGMPKLAI
jgi:hypothetical protein